MIDPICYLECIPHYIIPKNYFIMTDFRCSLYFYSNHTLSTGCVFMCWVYQVVVLVKKQSLLYLLFFSPMIYFFLPQYIKLRSELLQSTEKLLRTLQKGSTINKNNSLCKYFSFSFFFKLSTPFPSLQLAFTSLLQSTNQKLWGQVDAVLYFSHCA